MAKTTEGPKPGGESVVMTLRLPRELKFQIEELAKRSGRSTNNLIVWLLQNFAKMPLQEKARVNPGYYEDDDFSDLLPENKKKENEHVTDETGKPGGSQEGSRGKRKTRRYP
jgi:hypothetical protein